MFTNVLIQGAHVLEYCDLSRPSRRDMFHTSQFHGENGANSYISDRKTIKSSQHRKPQTQRVLTHAKCTRWPSLRPDDDDAFYLFFRGLRRHPTCLPAKTLFSVLVSRHHGSPKFLVRYAHLNEILLIGVRL